MRCGNEYGKLFCTSEERRQNMKRCFHRKKALFLRILLILAVFVKLATAQDETAVVTKPPAAAKPTVHLNEGAFNYAFQSGLTCGAGASTSSAATKLTVQCGGIMVWPVFEFEAGVMGPQANQSAVSGYLSANAWAPLGSIRLSHNRAGVPLATGGYTRMFETGHALDYGLGYAYPIDEAHSICFETRDYWAFSNPRQHNIVFRVAWLIGLSD